MNEQKTAILVDSGCDIARAQREKYNIEVLPLHVMYPEKDYADGVDIDPIMIYNRFPNEIPTTSTPSVAEVLDKFEEIKKEGYENVIAITISSSLSGTCNTIRLAATEVEDLNVFVFDTKNISIGAGIFAIWASHKLEHGVPYQVLCRQLQDKIRDSKVFFYMDTLKYLQHGGRIGRGAGTVGEMLRLKPLISCDETGSYYTVAKLRGSRLARVRLTEEIVKYQFGHKAWLVVEEGDAHQEAMTIKEILEKTLIDKKILFEQQITATMAVNTGPGLVGVAVFLEP